MKLESIILNDFFNLLNKNHINYCVMNNYLDMPEVIPSDVDFAICYEDYQKLDNLVYFIAKKYNVKITQKIWHGYNKCAYILSPINIESYFWLQLDLFVDFSGKGFPNLLPINDMLKSKIPYRNFFIPKPEIEVVFIFQRRVFKGDLELRHLDSMYILYIKDIEKVDKSLEHYFGKNISRLIKEIILKKDINLFNTNYKTLRVKLKQISKTNSSIIYLLSYSINQVFRTIYRVYYPNSLSILLTGLKKDELEDISIKIDRVISGSFHGTSTIYCDSKYSYIKNYLKKILIPKITKRKVFILSENDNISDCMIFKFLKLAPDVTIDFSKSENDSLSKVISEIMNIQANKTNKHLFSWLSPTSNKGIKLNEKS